MRFELFIAARYLRAKRRQAVVGVITRSPSSAWPRAWRADHRAGDHQRHAARSAGAAAGLDSARDLMRIAGDGIRDWRPLLERLARCRM